MKLRILTTSLITAAAVLAAASANSRAATPASHDGLFPRDYAIKLHIPSLARLHELTQRNALGALRKHSELSSIFERVSRILFEEKTIFDRAFRQMRAGAFFSDIMGGCGSSITVAVYPGAAGDRFPKILASFDLGNRSQTARKFFGRIASYVDESNIPGIEVKATPIGKIPCHKWSFEESLFPVYTAYMADSLAISNDAEHIRALLRSDRGVRNPAVDRLRVAARAEEADAVVTISTAGLGLLLNNLPVSAGFLQRFHGLLEKMNVKRITWAVKGKPGGVHERVAVEGLKLPSDSKPVITDHLKQVPREADIILLCSAAELKNLIREMPDYSGKMTLKPVTCSSHDAAGGPQALYAVLDASDNSGEIAEKDKKYSVLSEPYIRKIAAGTPLDAHVLFIADMDSVIEFLASKLEDDSACNLPEIVSTFTRLDNVFGFAAVTAMPARWGTLVEIRSRFAPGIPVIAIAAYTLHNVFSALREHRIRGNEASALTSLRSIIVAQELFRNRYGKFSGELSVLVREQYIDAGLEGGLSHGYIFRLSNEKDGNSFTVTATPVRPGYSGRKVFILDESGLIRQIR